MGLHTLQLPAFFLCFVCESLEVFIHSHSGENNLSIYSTGSFGYATKGASSKINIAHFKILYMYSINTQTINIHTSTDKL